MDPEIFSGSGFSTSFGFKSEILRSSYKVRILSDSDPRNWFITIDINSKVQDLEQFTRATYQTEAGALRRGKIHNL